MPVFTPDVLHETLDGGQAFRWLRQPDDTWLGTWSNHVVRLRLGAGERLEWSAPASTAVATADALATYFAAERNFATLTDLLPWRSDPHLARCLDAYRGLRILRQPFGETLLGFLCSATKQIVQIKQMLALLAERHGTAITLPESAPKEPIEGGTGTSGPGGVRIRVTPRPEVAALPLPPSSEVASGAATSGRGVVRPRLESEASANDPHPDPAYHRLPTWQELAQIPEGELRGCLLGFRARYIAETARFLAAHPGWLEETEAAPYGEAKARLCSLNGVGEKVADCVLLFGAGRLEAFPVDTWILKALARRYGLEGWKPAHVAQFGRAHFGPLAGLAQQFLFAYERSMPLAEPVAPGSRGDDRSAVEP
jgi:N-glycosylase/DNA lyase